MSRVLHDLSIPRGSTVLVEAPDIPDDENLCAETLEALLGAIGQSGTLVVPTCTASEGLPKPTFDPLLSPSESGHFSEFFRRQPGVLRSHNSTHSVAALGPLAENLTSGHRTAGARPSRWADTAFGIGSPWDLLRKSDAFWLLLGNRWSASVFPDLVRSLFFSENLRWTKVSPWPEFDPEALGQALQSAGITRAARSDTGLSVTLFRTGQAAEYAFQLLEDNPDQLAPTPQFSNWFQVRSSVRRFGYVQVGTGKSVITPAIPSVRWDGKPLRGVFRDLHARAVSFQHGECTVALVLCDLLGLSRGLVERIRRLAGEATGLAPSQIMVACTHSHGTPDTVASGYGQEEYLENLVHQVASAIVTAVRSATSARVGWTRVPIRGIAQSRRVRMTNGRVFTVRHGVPSTWRIPRELIDSRGEPDPDLTVLRVENLEGQPVAGLSNFGCHPSIALASDDVSGDFTGEAMVGLERILGENSVFLCSNGAGGDVDPTLEVPPWGPRTQEAAARVGRIFAAQVLESYEHTAVEDLAQVAFCQREISLQPRGDWLTLLEQEQSRMAQEFAGRWSLSDELRMVLETREIRTEVQAIRVGEMVLVGLPGEVLVEMARTIKSRCAPTKVTVVQLANDDIGYLPTRKAFEEGGYEVERHLWGRITPNGSDNLVEEAVRAVEAVSGQ